MVFYKRRRKNFRARRYRKRYVKRAPSAWSSAKNLAYKGYKLARYVKSLLNVEYKATDDNSVGGTLNTTPIIQLLTDTVQGTAANNRTGNSIKLKSLHVKGMLYSNTSATFSYMNRIIIFIDKDSRGSAPTAAELLVDPTDISSPINLLNGKRFVILYNKSYVTGTAGSGTSLYDIEYYKKFNMDITYQANLGTAADSDTNHIYMYFQTSNNTTPPHFDGYSRIRFIDN